MSQLLNKLQKKGLELSSSIPIILPDLEKPKPPLLTSLTNLITKNDVPSPIKPTKHHLRTFFNEYLIIGKGNTLVLYRYGISDDNLKPLINVLKVASLPIDIYRIQLYGRKLLQVGQIVVIIESGLSLGLCTINLMSKSINFKSEIKIGEMLDWKFVCESEILVLSKEYLCELEVVNQCRMEIGKKMKNELEIDMGESLLYAKILGSVDEDQQSHFRVLYITKNQKVISIKVKEYMKSVENGIRCNNTKYVACTIPYLSYFEEALKKPIIHEIKECICIDIKEQIIIIKKKFNQYFVLDNLIQKIHGRKLYLSEEGLISSITPQSFELNYLIISDPNCHSKLLDQISIQDRSVYQTFSHQWIFQKNKQPFVMFLFEREDHLQLSTLAKMEPMKKLLKLVETKGYKNLKIIQQLGQNLGIPKKEFYLNLWSLSQKEVTHIYQYLLPCEDIPSIKKQLNLTLRKKNILVSEFLKILDKITIIIKQQLKSSLSQPLLKEYIKNDFIMRKIKLYNVNMPLDCKSFNKIYNCTLPNIFQEVIRMSIYPKQYIFDPMLAMQNHKQQTQNLNYILQQFKLILLENYKQFLSDLLGKFKNDLLKVIKTYPYLLPRYPFNIQISDQNLNTQTLSKAVEEKSFRKDISYLKKSLLFGQETQIRQHPWFAEITWSDWNRQLHRQKIQNYLHDFYPTSTINYNLNSIIESDYCRNNKLGRHVLISTFPQSFKSVIQPISGTKLYYLVCEMANHYALSEGLQLSQGPQIVNILKRYHGLPNDECQKISFYVEMHFFLLKHQIIECSEKKLSIQELIQLNKQPQNLIALFFLGNHQKKEYLLNGFIQIYKKNQQFNFTINRFIDSHNCSRIELYILLQQIISKGKQFQVDNQQLIDIVIMGFCKKMEIRQYKYMESFLKLVGELELEKEIVIKVHKMSQLKQCKNILYSFNWDAKTYYELLENSKTTLENLLQCYFQGQINDSSLIINDIQLMMQFPRNMLNVLLFLKETIFYQLSQRQVLLIYGFVLIQWKQFDVIRAIVHQERIPQKLGLSQLDYIQTLMTNCLTPIYQNTQCIWSQQFTHQVEGILSIDIQDTPFKIKQEAKLELIELFESWGYDVIPSEIWLLAMSWKEPQRKECMLDIIDQFNQHLNFKVLVRLYSLLQCIDKESRQINIENEEFISYTLYLSSCLLPSKRFKDIIQLLSYVKGFENIPINYNLISESFLQCIISLYSSQPCKAKRFVEYYSQFWNSNQEIKYLFQTYFDEQVLNSWKCFKQIKIDSVICFKNAEAFMKVDDIWLLCQDKDSIVNTIYTYYFMMMMIRLSDYVLTRIHNISYNIQHLLKCIQKFELLVDENNDYWGINVYEVMRRFKKGLYIEAITRIPDIKSQLQQSPDEYQLDMIKNILKRDKEKNGELLKNISYVENYLQINLSKMQERRIRNQNQILQLKKATQNNILPEIQEEQQIPINVTIKYKQLKAKKVDISRQCIFINEKDIIDQIFEDAIQQKMQQRANKNYTSSFMSGTRNIIEKSLIEKQVTIIELINNCEYEQLNSFKQSDVIHAAETIYLRPSVTFNQMIDKLNCMKIGNSEKLKIGSLCKFYQGGIKDQDLKEIFNFNFFIKIPKQSQYQTFADQIFSQIEKNLAIVLSDKEIDEIVQIGHFMEMILGKQVYRQRVFLCGLKIIGSSDNHTPKVLRLFKELFRFLVFDEQFFIKQVLPTIKQGDKNSKYHSLFKQNLIALPRLSNQIMQNFTITYQQPF